MNGVLAKCDPPKNCQDSSAPLGQARMCKCEQAGRARANTVTAWGFMDDTSHALKGWVVFAGCVLRHCRPLLGAGGARASRTRRAAHLRPDTPCQLARAVARPRPGCARGSHAGVHRSRPRRLGSRAADGPSGRRPPHLSREYPGEGFRRPRSRKGRVGREASADDRGHQDGAWTIEPARSNGPRGAWWSLRSRSGGSRAFRGLVRWSVRWGPPGSCWRWWSSCCSNAGISAAG